MEHHTFWFVFWKAYLQKTAEKNTVVQLHFRHETYFLYLQLFGIDGRNEIPACAGRANISRDTKKHRGVHRKTNKKLINLEISGNLTNQLSCLQNQLL